MGNIKDCGRSWAKGLRSLILKQLVERGPLTTHEAAGFCQVNVTAAAPRFSELETLGLVRVIGSRHSISGRGRPLKVWEATGLKLSGSRSQERFPSTEACSPLSPFSSLS